MRLIIKVYEDKLNRLKEVERSLTDKVVQLNENDEEANKVIDYFRNERDNLIQELEALKNGHDQSKYIKELLKEAKVLKDEGDDDSLQIILSKNNEFLQNLKAKLQ